ncbi:MAG: alpha/beta fold hydrolase [Actinomycetota bacterium]
MDVPETKYARSGNVSIAYNVSGEGPRDLVMVPGYVSHLELLFEFPPAVRFLRRLGSFARVIVFDKRGTGMSDPVEDVPTLEERMDDIRAVMDAARSERASFLAVSEGAPLSLLFGATYPARCVSLILCGGIARSTWAPDFDHEWAPRVEDLERATREYVVPMIEAGEGLEIFAPSWADDPAMRQWYAKWMRYGVSPAMLEKTHRMFLDIDVRDVLPAVHVPTLVMHRRGDRVVNRRAGKWLADHIAGARFVELAGRDHVVYAGDQDAMLDEIQEFLTGARGVAEADRVLATLLFTDIVASTDHAASVGDSRWRRLLDEHDAIIRGNIEKFRGREVKTTGDGVLATFDGPARAIRCANAITGEVRRLGIEIKAGIHTGEVEMRGEDIGGIAVHTAARVMAAALPGETLVSRTVKDLVAGSGIEFEDRGAHELKGIPGEWALFAVVS